MRWWPGTKIGVAGVSLIAATLGVAPEANALAAGSGAGTNIGNAIQLTGNASGSLASSTSDDWWVIYPATAGGSVTVTVKNTTATSTMCHTFTASLDATNGTSHTLTGVTLSPGSSQRLAGSSTGSDRYFVEVMVDNCEPTAGHPVTYTVTVDSGGGGAAPSPAAGSIAAGTSIGDAWPPLQGKTSYTGTIASESSDAWYVLYKKADNSPATIRVENTTVAGTVTCASLSVSLDAAEGTAHAVSGATLSDNSAETFSLPGRSATDLTGLYYLEVHSPDCPGGGVSYRIEPEPGSQWQNPSKLPGRKIAPGSSIGSAWPPLQGSTTYDGTITSGADENWYVLYKRPGTNPASVRVEDTTVAGTTSCPGLTVSLDAADGNNDTLTGATLGDNAASTMPIPTTGTADYLGRYYLEIRGDGCPSSGATYRIEPEPDTGWADPAKPASGSLPAGPDQKAAGGPLTGGVTYDAALSNGTTQDWIFFDATGSTPLTISVQDTTSSQDNCQAETVSVRNASSTVSGATLGDDDEAELVVDTAQTFYLEISVAGDCPPDTPLTATVTLTPPGGARRPVLKISRTTLSGGVAHQAYGATIKVSGGKPGYHFTAESPLPDGLKLNKLTGRVSGTPAKTGTDRFWVKITDSRQPDPDMATDQFKITITAHACSCTCRATSDHDPAKPKPPCLVIMAQTYRTNPPGPSSNITNDTFPVMVGEKITLTAEAQTAAGSSRPSSTWTIPGTKATPPTVVASFGDKDRNLDGKDPALLTKLTTNPVTFYLANGQARPLVIQVEAVVQGHKLTAKTTLAVYTPTLSTSAATTCRVAANNHTPDRPVLPPGVFLGFNDDCHRTPGIKWNLKANVPRFRGRQSGTVITGELGVSQIINITATGTLIGEHKPTTYSTRGNWCADNWPLYHRGTKLPLNAKDPTVSVRTGGANPPWGSLDVPGIGFLASSTKGTVSGRFRDFVVYRPVNGIWVPLGGFTWAFQAGVNVDAHGVAKLATTPTPTWPGSAKKKKTDTLPYLTRAKLANATKHWWPTWPGTFNAQHPGC